MQDRHPAASAIIPTYNRPQVLVRAIKSVLGQTFGDFELLVVDDASTEDTEAMVRSFRDPRIRYMRQKVNRGPAAGRDRGIEASRGEYVAFLDDDDEWLPEFLERINGVFESDHDRRIAVVETGIYTDSGDVRLFDSRDVFENLLTLRRGICMSSIAVRRTALGDDLRFDDGSWFTQDRHLFMELARQHAFVSVAEPLAKLHREPGDHLQVPSTRLAKKLHFLSLHADELADRPIALARHHGRIGIVYIHSGDHRAARAAFRRASESWPRGFRWRLYYLMTFFGKRSNLVLRVTTRLAVWARFFGVPRPK